ncbi:MAG TPA: hypothetical protein VGD66_16320 [Allosphingosinicella sp.]
MNDPARPSEKEIRRRQKARALLMGLLLGAFVVLVYAITIAKMSINR